MERMGTKEAKQKKKRRAKVQRRDGTRQRRLATAERTDGRSESGSKVHDVHTTLIIIHQVNEFNCRLPFC